MVTQNIQEKLRNILSFFFFLVGPLFGPWMGPNLAGFNEARWGEFGPREKNPFSKRAGFGLRVWVWKNPARTQPKPDPLPFLILKEENDVDHRIHKINQFFWVWVTDRWPSWLMLSKNVFFFFFLTNICSN